MKLTLTPYNICRILLALSLLLTFLFNSPYVLFGKYLHGAYSFDSYTLFYLFSSNLQFAVYLSIFVLVLVILGVYPRIISVLHWYITFSFIVASDVTYGGDHIASNITLLLIPLSFYQNRVNHYFK